MNALGHVVVIGGNMSRRKVTYSELGPSDGEVRNAELLRAEHLEDRRRVTRIKQRGKTGGYISEEDMKLLLYFRKKFPVEYKEIEEEVAEWAMASMNPLWKK